MSTFDLFFSHSQLENKGPWMNPEAPVAEKSENYGTECDVANCPFFLKTGACRFGDRYTYFSFAVTYNSSVLTRL